MKAIYIIFNEKVYRMNQSTTIPNELTFRAPGVSATSSEDKYNKEVSFTIGINTLEKPGTKSNKELVQKMKELMWDKMITEIPYIQNKFKLFVDYSVYDKGVEIDHQSVMKPMCPRDKAYMLGVATNDETVYRRVKTFNPTLEFRTHNTLPHGIMGNQTTKYEFKINNIAVFEDFSETPNEIPDHSTVMNNPYEVGSESINSSLKYMTLIYSTENEGIEIDPLVVSYIPRKVIINLDIIFANLIVVYNDKDITDLLVNIIESKYAKETGTAGSDVDDPDRLIQDDETKPSADGDYTPDEDGHFDYYERCTKANPNSLLVVEDLIPDGSYIVESMIKKNMVIKDIPDIKVGEYVHYCESFITVNS